MTISTSPSLVRFDALAFADAVRESAPTGGVSVLVEWEAGSSRVFPATVLAAGPTGEVDRHEAARSPRLRVVRRPSALLLPGMVNAHTHLDLTHLGPRPHDPAAGFVAWIRFIREGRHSEPGAIAASVALGAQLSLQAGVVAVGDIAGAVAGRASLAAVDGLAKAALAGVSFVEFFAIGAGEARGLAALEVAMSNAHRKGLLAPGRPVRLGVQPHAPYTVSRAAYAALARLAPGVPACTHLAESPEEHDLISRGTGPLRDMLEEFGLWTQELDNTFGHADSPLAFAREAIVSQVRLLVHVNQCSDADLDTLAGAGVSVAYCPRAAAYFGAETHFGPHRYRDMLNRGVNVALGTDSIVNLPADATQRGLSILDEMRFLHARDRTDPRVLLAMGTVNGARALGLALPAFEIQTGGPLAGLVAVPLGMASTHPPLDQALRSDAEPELLLNRARCPVER